jgi:hypothetical protein
MDFALIFDWVLRIAGILTLVAGFVSFFINSYEFDVNVYINRISKSDSKKYKNAIEYIDNNVNGEFLLFIPQGNTNFKNVRYYECMYVSNKFKKTKILQNFKNINFTNGLIINTYYPCGVPSRILEWEAEYGVKGNYILSENGKDGDVKHGNFFYKYNFLAKLRKIIGWK